MELLTIGAFARAARLTPKALRLYDQVGLLPPAAVDPESGYRLYDQRQLDRARLIAELRRIDMPLAEIRTVCAMGTTAAAEAVAAYWRRVSTDTAARALRAALLVEHLSGKDAMTDTDHSLDIRCATACDIGAVRDSNEDAVYASSRLLCVADGMRGPGGALASAAAIEAIKPLEQVDACAADLLALLATAVTGAGRAVCELATDDHQPVTTLTALLRSGSQLAMVHIGDTRAYLLRGGELSQLTIDHTWVQGQVDAGKLDHVAAATHPSRALLVRALGAGGQWVEADLALRTALPGDRYLLCTDGLSAVVDRTLLHTTLSAGTDPDQTVRHLVGLANAEGSPDNIACIVADIVAT